MKPPGMNSVYAPKMTTSATSVNCNVDLKKYVSKLFRKFQNAMHMGDISKLF